MSNRPFIFLFCLLNLQLFSQRHDYNQKITEGNYLFLERNYIMAIQQYELAYAIDSSNANINYKVGVCYLNIPGKKKKALPYLDRAVKDITKSYDEDEPSVKSAPYDAIFYHAKALHYASRFAEALEEFDKFKRMLKKKDVERMVETQRLMEMCQNAVILSKEPEHITITNLGDSVNSEYPDYGPVANADESVLLFTSRRPGMERGLDGAYYEDIFTSKRNSDGSWCTASKLFSLVNTSSNEAVIGLSANGQKAYFYRDEDLFYSTLTEGAWSALVPFGPEVNSKDFESHITFTPDDSVLYFVSDRPGGMGGKDIYRCVKMWNGQWSAAFNLGPTINTKYDEESPYIHPEGKFFYFSSEGHNSVGGLDIFYSLVSLDSIGNFSISKPTSMGVPMNTPDDDVFYVPTANGIHAYFSSAREGGHGDQDLYISELPKAIRKDAAVLLYGIVTFDGKHERPHSASIQVFDASTNTLVGRCKPDSNSGKYLVVLDPGVLGKKYLFKYEADGFPPSEQSFDVLPGMAFSVTRSENEIPFMNMESRSRTTISMGGLITNEDLESIVDVKILIKDNNTGQLLNTLTTSSDVGYYYIVLDKGKNYNISFEAPGYLFQSQNVEVADKPDQGHIEIIKSIKLERIQVGAKMTLNNIFFDKNKAVLRKQSMVEMESVYKLLKEQTGLVMEISGHTDNAGNDKVNLKLSQDRAQSVVNYLVKKGINKKQLKAKGYGKTMPVADNATDEGKQKNRRVEMKIVDAK